MAMMKREEEEPEQGAAWLATYSDMVTLLFTFFVLMFAISNVDAMKFAILAKALSGGGITAEELVEIQEEYQGDLSGNDLYDLENPEWVGPGKTDKEHLVEGDDSGEEGAEEEDWEKYLNELHSLLATYIDENDLSDSIFLHEGDGADGDKLLLTLTSDVWFASGSAELSEPMRETAATLGKLLSDTYRDGNKFDIVVSGHTDNIPQNTPPYEDNWALSFARAGNFMRVLMNESGISPHYYSARGYGEEAPIDTNDTPEGRQKNRRVDILISNTKR